MAKQKTTYDRFFKNLTPMQKKKFDAEYRELLLSELKIAEKLGDSNSKKKLMDEIYGK